MVYTGYDEVATHSGDDVGLGPSCLFGYTGDLASGDSGVNGLPAVGNSGCSSSQNCEYDGSYDYALRPDICGPYNSPGGEYCGTVTGDSSINSVGSQDLLVGIAYDGHPVMGPYDSDGKMAIGLDNCNGKVFISSSFHSSFFWVCLIVWK